MKLFAHWVLVLHIFLVEKVKKILVFWVRIWLPNVKGKYQNMLDFIFTQIIKIPVKRNHLLAQTHPQLST